MVKQHLMTREQFESFVTGLTGHRGGSNGPLLVYVEPPYDVVPCDCGDLNCHGWRFVERRGAPAVRVVEDRELAYAGV